MVSYAGTSSMEVCVQITIEDVLKNERHLAALSFLTFVALDNEGKPSNVPQVYPESKTENWFHETSFQFLILDTLVVHLMVYLHCPVQQKSKNSVLIGAFHFSKHPQL